MLVDGRYDLTINRNYYGYAVRTDRWSARGVQHPWHIVYLVLEGTVPGRVNGRPFQLEPETLFWLSPDVALEMTWPDRLVFTELWFRLTRRGRDMRLPDDCLIVPRAGELWPVFRRIEDELTMGGPMTEQKLRHQLATLCIDLLRLRDESPGSRRLSPAQCRRLSEHVRRRIHERPAIEELASIVDLSADYFSRCFSETFGLPPRDWLIRQRIREATRLLTTTNLAVYQVADQLGYQNVSQFSRQFHRQAGVSPRVYRQRHGA